MANTFKIILTKRGQQEIAQSHINHVPITIDKFSVGDSNGVYYEPDQNQIDLVNPILIKIDLDNVSADEFNANWIVIEGIIPADHTVYGVQTGFYIREVGLWSSSGFLFAIAKWPEQYKPIPAEGSTRDLIIRCILSVSNPEDINLSINSNVAVASRSYVDAQFASKLTTVDVMHDMIISGFEAVVPNPPSFTMTITEGVAYPNGNRVVKLSTDPDLTHIYAAASDTYVDVTDLNEIVYTPVSNDVAPPAIALAGTRLMRVVTNATEIVRVDDLRDLTIGFKQDVSIDGNLQVKGAVTYVNSANLQVADKNVAVNVGGTTGTAAGAGLQVVYDNTIGTVWHVQNGSEFVWSATDVNYTGSIPINSNVGISGYRFTVTARIYQAGTGTRLTLDVVYPGATDNSAVLGLSTPLADLLYDGTLASRFKIGAYGGESEIVSVAHTQYLYNKFYDDATNIFQNTSSPTKRFRFDAGNITPGQTRVFSLPDLNDTIVTLTAPQTLTQKTLTSPTLTSPSMSNPTLTGYGTYNGLEIATKGQVGDPDFFGPLFEQVITTDSIFDKTLANGASYGGIILGRDVVLSGGTTIWGMSYNAGGALPLWIIARSITINGTMNFYGDAGGNAPFGGAGGTPGNGRGGGTTGPGHLGQSSASVKFGGATGAAGSIGNGGGAQGNGGSNNMLFLTIPGGNTNGGSGTSMTTQYGKIILALLRRLHWTASMTYQGGLSGLDFVMTGGATGGGAGANSAGGAGGGGGGSIVLIAMDAITIGAGAIIDLHGGNGGNGNDGGGSGNGGNGGGGGGGGGGSLIMYSLTNNITNAGSVSLSGGIGGTAVGGINGGNGGNGLIITL